MNEQSANTTSEKNDSKAQGPRRPGVAVAATAVLVLIAAVIGWLVAGLSAQEELAAGQNERDTAEELSPEMELIEAAAVKKHRPAGPRRGKWGPAQKRAYWEMQKRKAIAAQTPPPAKAGEAGINVALIVLDTLRADHVGVYGSKRDTTPFLDSLARQSVTFTNVFSTAPWTVPAMFSMFTGLYPSEHGITDGTMTGGHNKVVGQQVLPGEAVTLTEVMQQGGYTTLGICTNYHLNKQFGFSQGFEHFIGDDFRFLPFPDIAIDAALPRLRRAPKYFLWLHYLDPHFPFYLQSPWFGQWNESKLHNYQDFGARIMMDFYRDFNGIGDEGIAADEHVEPIFKLGQAVAANLPSVAWLMRRLEVPKDHDYVKFLQAAYASNVRQTDEAVERAFAKLGIDDETLVIVVSDHGEELYDNGWWGHRHTLRQNLIHVPMMIRLPKKKAAGKKIDSPVSLVDLMPTVLELTGQPIPQNLSGKSLVPLMEGEAMDDRPLFVETDYLGTPLRGIVEFPWKYMRNQKKGTEWLFHLGTDPLEEKNVAEDNAAKTAKLRKKLDEWVSTAKPDWDAREIVPLSPAQLEKLKKLGYFH